MQHKSVGKMPVPLRAASNQSGEWGLFLIIRDVPVHVLRPVSEEPEYRAELADRRLTVLVNAGVLDRRGKRRATLMTAGSRRVVVAYTVLCRRRRTVPFP